MDKSYKLGIIGYGGMGKWHHINTEKLDFVKAVAVYDIAQEARERAQNHGLRTYSTLEEILEDDEVDIIVIATPNEFHCPYAIKSFEAGKHVVCEKPVTLNSEELQQIIDSANAHKKVFSVHQNRRWDSDYRIIKQIYDNNELGNIFSIQSRVMGSRGIPGDWRAKKAHGGGMVLDWGVHLIDQALDMVKEKVTDVYVRMQHVRHTEVDDGFQLFLTFESGLVYLIEVSTAAYISLPRWHVSGDFGTAIVEDWSCNGKIIRPIRGKENVDATPIQAGAGLTKTMAPRGEESTVELPLPKITTNVYKDYYGNFVAAIEGREELIVKHHEVMRVMKIMEATFQSEAENSSIRVNI
ncbi:MAG: Gfo/Idh/MocA family oxidoreductase [Eubacteriales bacterium]|jgi:predicted dehydrogenase|nr:Gfo/Idh/MocA family oxidoreductase [Eubacteriales bacterium]